MLVNPGRNLTKHPLQKRLVQMRRIEQREVQVLGKPIGFEVAFLEAGSALEHPFVRKLRMRKDAGECPAQRVVLFDNARVKPNSRRRIRGVLAFRSLAGPTFRDAKAPARH